MVELSEIAHEYSLCSGRSCQGTKCWYTHGATRGWKWMVSCEIAKQGTGKTGFVMVRLAEEAEGNFRRHFEFLIAGLSRIFVCHCHLLASQSGWGNHFWPCGTSMHSMGISPTFGIHIAAVEGLKKLTACEILEHGEALQVLAQAEDCGWSPRLCAPWFLDKETFTIWGALVFQLEGTQLLQHPLFLPQKLNGGMQSRCWQHSSKGIDISGGKLCLTFNSNSGV